MTRRDLHWRLGGLALFAAAAGLGFASHADAVQSNAGLNAPLGVVAFLLYLAGAVLVIQGERLPRAWAARHVARPQRPAARPRVKPRVGDRTRH